MEKGALKNFTKFTVKHLCQSLVFNKVAGMVADIPNSGRAMNSGQNVQSQVRQSFLNYLPVADTSR